MQYIKMINISAIIDMVDSMKDLREELPLIEEIQLVIDDLKNIS